MRALLLLTAVWTTLGACSHQATAPSPVPGVTITTPTTSLTLAQGDRASIALTIVRTGAFSGPVTLGVSGSPAGIAVGVRTNPVTDAAATLDVVVGDGAGPGSYRLTLSATGAGIQPQVIPLDLHVTPRSSVAVTVAYCTGIEPTWVAFQDGDGSWTRAFPQVSGANTTFHQVFASNRGGIATLSTLADGALTLLSVLYGTPAELASVGDILPIDCRAGPPKTLLGTVAGLDTNESAFVNARFSSRALVLPTAGGTFALGALPGGPQDILATRTTRMNGGAAVTGVILRRDIDLPDGATLPALDFTSPEAFVPATAGLSIAGLGPEGATSGTQLRTTNGEMVFSFLTNQPTAVTRPYFALPDSRLLPGDLQTLHVSTNGPSSVNRTADLYFRSASDRTVMLGAPLISPTLSAVATAPSLRVRAQFVAQSDYDRATSIVFEQAPTSALVSISMTAAYGAITGGGYDLVVPELSGVAGFDSDWALRPGVRLDWSAIRIGGTLALGRDVVPSDGATQRRAFRKDTITVR